METDVLTRQSHTGGGVGWLFRQPAVFVALFALALMWPGLINGGPIYYGDSAGYFKGGRLAFEFVGHLFARGGEGGGAGGAPSTEGIMGVRSVAYSVFLHLLRAPGASGLAACAVQALATAYCVWLLLRAVGVDRSPLAMFVFAGLIVLATPAPWFAMLIGPDIFAGLALLAVLLLMAWPGAMNLVERLILGGLIAFAVPAHLSHVPFIGLIVALAGAVMLTRGGRGRWVRTVVDYAWIAAPALLGLIGTVAINAIGFHEPTVSGKRYPILLARSIEDGPARKYLESHCASERWAVCELYVAFPRTAGDFLWEEDGVRHRATADQLERIRKEEPEILRRAIAAYPLDSFVGSARQALLQLVKVGLTDHHLEYRLEMNGRSVETREFADPHPLLKQALGVWYLLVMLAAVGLSGWLFATGRMRGQDRLRTLVLAALAGCAINAAVCGGLSASTDRYQGRVIWVLVICAAAAAWSLRGTSPVRVRPPEP